MNLYDHICTVRHCTKDKLFFYKQMLKNDTSYFIHDFSDNFSDGCSTVDKRQTRPYIAPAHLCSYCDKIVHGSSTHLRYHVNAVHLKVRPYKCSFCDRSFAVKHKRKHHEIKFHKSSVDANFGTDYKRDGL